MSTDTINAYKLNVSVELTREWCSQCGVQFAMPTTMRDACLRNHSKDFYCPNGHSMRFLGKTEAEKLAGQLDQAQRSLAWVRTELAQTEAQRRAQKGLVTKLKNRAKAGMCSECRRTFQNVARHMQTQHGAER